MRDNKDKLDYVIMMKNSTGDKNVWDELKKSIEDILGRGLAVPEWTRVLIIDDESEPCRNVKDMFRVEGFRADSAATTDEALQKLEQDLYDLLLIDIKLECKISRIDIIESFKTKEKRPKIIVLSSVPRDEIKSFFNKKGLAHLVDRYLDKSSCPIPGRLINRVTDVMEQCSQ